MLQRPPDGDLSRIFVILLRKPEQNRMIELAHHEWRVPLNRDTFLLAVLYYRPLLTEWVQLDTGLR